MIGSVVGNYKIIDKIGEGGMGSVFKGVDLMLEREVAIKMLRPACCRAISHRSRDARQAKSSKRRYSAQLFSSGRRFFHGDGIRARRNS